MPLSSKERRPLVQPERDIHTLHRRAGRALPEIVEQGDQQRALVVARDRDVQLAASALAAMYGSKSVTLTKLLDA